MAAGIAPVLRLFKAYAGRLFIHGKNQEFGKLKITGIGFGFDFECRIGREICDDLARLRLHKDWSAGPEEPYKTGRTVYSRRRLLG